jgi:methionine-rich copper-binding protein CopC
MSRLLRISVYGTVAIVVTLTPFVAALTPDPAQAAITSTSPIDGAWLAQPPAAVELSSTVPLVPDLSHVSVLDRSGTALNSGRPILVVPETLRQPVNITTAGDVTVTYHVTLVDGAQLAGTLRFSVGTLSLSGIVPAIAPSTATTNSNEAVAGSAHRHGIDPISAAMLILDGVAVLAAIVLLMRRPRTHVSSDSYR